MAYRSIKPWSTSDPLRALLFECGVSDPEAVAETGWHPLRAPEDWWTILLGTGYDRPSTLYLPQIVNESGSLRSMQCDERTLERFVPM